MFEPRQSPESVPPLDIPDTQDGSLDLPDADEPTVEDLPNKPRLLRWRPPRGPLSMSLHRVRILAAGMVVILLVALIGLAIQSRIPVVQYTTVKTGTLTVQFSTTGTLQSATYAANFAGSGRIAQIEVSVGQQVNAGDTLAKLDTTQLEDAVNQAQAAVSAAQQKASDAQDNFDKVQAATAAQVQTAYDTEQNTINTTCAKESGSAKATCIQDAQNSYAAAQAQADQENSQAQLLLDDAQAALSNAQAVLQTAQDNLNGATLVAPHAGTIAAINQQVGSTVVGSNATAPVTNFIVIADLNALQIQSSVPLAHVAGVQNGTLVRFTVPSASDQQFQGQVDGVSPTGTLVNNVLSYPMTISVDMQSVQSKNTHLYPGMTASVHVIVVDKPGVTLIPASAVAFAQAAGDPQAGGFLTKNQAASVLQRARDLLVEEEDAGAIDSSDVPVPAYVLQYTNNKWVPVPILLGLTDGTSYEVLKGLIVGEKIVTGETNSPVRIPTPTAIITH